MSEVYHIHGFIVILFFSMKSDWIRVMGANWCSDSLASLTRSPVSSAGRASDLQVEGCGFESYTG